MTSVNGCNKLWKMSRFWLFGINSKISCSFEFFIEKNWPFFNSGLLQTPSKLRGENLLSRFICNCHVSMIQPTLISFFIELNVRNKIKERKNKKVDFFWSLNHFSWFYFSSLKKVTFWNKLKLLIEWQL